MTFARLLCANIAYFWRTNLATILGCFAGASVLTGALLVGDSMRGSLRAMTLERLGGIDYAMVGGRFFNADLPDHLPKQEGRPKPTAAILIRGTATGPDGKHAYRVNIIGTSEAFWELFPLSVPEDYRASLPRRTILNAELAERIDAKEGQEIEVFVERASNSPREQVLGERHETLRPLHQKIDQVIPTSDAGRFSLEASQQLPLNLYMPLEDLAKALEQPGRANALLFPAGAQSPSTETLTAEIRQALTLDDYGLKVLSDERAKAVWLESSRLTLDDPTAFAALAAAKEIGSPALPVLTQLATEIRIGKHSIPYSVVSAIGDGAPSPIPTLPAGGIALNRWAADELKAKEGDSLKLQYFEVQPDGRLATREQTFRLASVVPMEPIVVDAHFAPTYPGITDAKDFGSWHVPFSLDQQKIRKQDEAYWKQYRTAPKAFLRLEDGQRIWGNRFGKLSGVRLAASTSTKNEPLAATAKRFQNALLARLRPEEAGMVLQPVKQMDLQSSAGSTPFDVLFLAFSFFLIVAAALLVGLLFRLNTERRAKQVGLLLAVGAPSGLVRRLLLAEGLILALIGGLAGLLGALAYAQLMIAGLTSSWQAAVGTPFIHLHWSWPSLLVGLAVSTALAMSAIVWGVWGLGKAPIPRLLSVGFTFASAATGRRRNWLKWFALASLVAGAAMPFFVGGDDVGAFFGSGVLLLIGALAGFAFWLRREPVGVVHGSGNLALMRLGIRNAGRYPARSVLTVGLLSFATFVIVAVSAFRHGEDQAQPQVDSPDGGFSLAAESATPLFSPPNAGAAGELNLTERTTTLLRSCDVFALRVRAGDDASCLNIYQPRNPTLLGVDARFRERKAFRFAGLAKDATAEEKENPWRLLERDYPDGAIAAIGDQETMDYILKVGVGADLEIPDENGKPLKLRFVAGLKESIFQGQLLVAERKLLERFPAIAGYRFFLFDSRKLPAGAEKELGQNLEIDLTDFGFDVATTAKRLAAYRAVANTYIATFQALGGLGLLLGAFGLAAVLLRNVLERRGELALLRAVGFTDQAIGWLVLAENLFLLFFGVLVGSACAVVAILPQLMKQTSLPDLAPLAGLLLAVLGVGLVSGAVAVVAALRAPLIPALRSE